MAKDLTAIAIEKLKPGGNGGKSRTGASAAFIMSSSRAAPVLGPSGIDSAAGRANSPSKLPTSRKCD